MTDKPLQGLLVLDFSQFLAGPAAATRLGDLGARVIKIERPGTGDICRQLYISNLGLDGDSTLFHSINRNKQSFAADLKNLDHRRRVEALITQADVLIENFRPGVMARLGLDYEAVARLNPRLVYGTVTGYGPSGPWANRPGQDLLAQALSGLCWLTGNAEDPPTPMGLAVADLTAGANLVQGILACLVRRGISNRGGRVEVSLLESILDLQFEVLTTFLNDGEKPPQRSAERNAHAYLGAPYGIYPTEDSYIAIAMGSVPALGKALMLPSLEAYDDATSWFSKRDEIKKLLAEHLHSQSTAHWMDLLLTAGFWAAEVLTWKQLMETEAFRVLNFVQTVTRDDGPSLRTTRCPISIDGQPLTASRGAPRVGQHTESLLREFKLPS